MPRPAVILNDRQKAAKKRKRNNGKRLNMQKARSTTKEGEFIPRARITRARYEAKRQFLKELSKEEESKKEEFKNRAGFLTTNADIIFASLSSLLPYSYEGKRDRKQELRDHYNQNTERHKGTSNFRCWASPSENLVPQCDGFESFILAAKFYTTCTEWEQYLWRLYEKNYVLRYEHNYLRNLLNQKNMTNKDKMAAEEYLAGRAQDHKAWVAEHEAKEAVRRRISALRVEKMKARKAEQDAQHQLDVLTRERLEAERKRNERMDRLEKERGTLLYSNLLESDDEDEDRELLRPRFYLGMSWSEFERFVIYDLEIDTVAISLLRQAMEDTENSAVNSIPGITWEQALQFRDRYKQWSDYDTFDRMFKARKASIQADKEMEELAVATANAIPRLAAATTTTANDGSPVAANPEPQY